MKLLSGQCEKDFNYYLSYFDICENHDIIHWKHSNEEILENLPIPIRFAVIQAFADSVGIQIEVLGNKHHSFEVFIGLNLKGYFKTRKEAQQQAIIKFNDIYNEKYCT